MCLLTYIPEGVQPNRDNLLNGTLMNDDGHGFGMIIDGRILVRKSLKADKLIDEFMDLRKRHPDKPAIFHSRFTTDGINGKYNVHPFPIGGDPRTVIAHNGVFPSEARPKVGDIRSDTRIVAEKLIPARRNWTLYTRRGRRKFGKWMGTGNKVAVLTIDPKYMHNGYIINEDLGMWDDGIWYSNTGYLDWVYNNHSEQYGHKQWWNEDWDGQCADRNYPPPIQGTFITWEDGKWVYKKKEERSLREDCTVCKLKETVNPVTLYCSICKSCQECQQDWDNCLCFMPSSLEKTLEDLPKAETDIGWPFM